jgi:NAD(P)-dependent dehydrogenase (short-subunit alcohol dehydrogenase family)
MIKEFENWIFENIETQKGKTVIITGGNSGIGYYTALGLAKVGANVIIVGRDEKRLKTAVEELRKEKITGTINSSIMDLSSLSSVKEFTDNFNQNNSKLDLLINNAGVMMPPESKTKEGFELQFGVNFLGHFLLTNLLFEKLKNTKNSRVITLSSIAHRGASIDFENLKVEKEYDAKREYYQSKLADLLFTLELVKRFEKGGIMSIGCHPGFTKTELQRHLNPDILKNFKFMDAWQGSLPTLFAATNKTVKAGDYYGPNGEGEYSGFPSLGIIDKSALEVGLSEKLWRYALENTKKYLN